MKFHFETVARHARWTYIKDEDWNSWTWQVRNSISKLEQFQEIFDLDPSEVAGFDGLDKLFSIRVTPYYASLAATATAKALLPANSVSTKSSVLDPIRRILMPRVEELTPGWQQMRDPLGEKRNSPVPRIIHRYPDRLLFLPTDFCSVYCRYCTRKHFTGQDQAFVNSHEYTQALSYIRQARGVREVILSGGDPLTLSDANLKRILTDLRSIEHIEIIRIGTRMPVVCPMRVTSELVSMLKEFHPVYMMVHFNHPREVTAEAAFALKLLADSGFPIMNQLVLLNGVNNHPAVIQALSRRLLYLRCKPYYMFQCDPSLGTDHLRTSIEDSMSIQRELWGNLSGLAMPNLAVDVPDGGGKVGVVPNFEISSDDDAREADGDGKSSAVAAGESSKKSYIGWDGVRADYISPPQHTILKPIDAHLYQHEWDQLRNAKVVVPALNQSPESSLEL